MIHNAFDQVWSRTPGHADEALTPMILPPYPSQYCFPEAKDIRTNLSSSTDSTDLVIMHVDLTWCVVLYIL